MSRVLPERPDLDHLKHQAKSLLEMLRSGDVVAAERCRSVGADAAPKLANAQHVIAREYGFPSWARLKIHVESRTANPGDAFIQALKDNDVARVRDLLVRHPDLKATINDGSDVLGFGATPLIAAVQRGSRDMIETLLGAGADLNAKSDWWAGGFSVLESAPEPLLPFLVERGAVVDVTAAARFGLLNELAAIVAGNPEVVHTRSGDGKTPLHWAKDLATAQFLVEHGVDLNARDVDHESTPAQYMARDRQEVVRYLIARGAITDIFLAAAVGDLGLVREILDRDPAAIDMVINEEHFPKQNPRAGGSIYIWTLGQGKTPHVVAQEFGHAEVFNLLMERSPEELKLTMACVLGDEALFNRVLAAHPSIATSMPPGYGRKLLDAAVNNNANAVRLMLRAGWPVDARGPHGGTALHWAAWHGNVAMLREVLKYGPSLDRRDNAHNIPPLGWALHGSLHGWHATTGDYGDVVTALIDAGADTANVLPTMEGSAAAMAAFERGRRKASK